MTLRIVTTDAVVFGTSMPTIGLPGHRRLDAERRRGERQREVVRQARDLVDADAGARDLSVRVCGLPSLSIRLAALVLAAATVRVLISQPGSTSNWVTSGPR